MLFVHATPHGVLTSFKLPDNITFLHELNT